MILTTTITLTGSYKMETITITSVDGVELYTHTTDGNTLKETVRIAVKAEADLSHAELSGADLRGAKIRGADLSHADLSHADLCGADLRGACLKGACLRGLNLVGASLHHADLRGADLRGADFRVAELEGVKLEGAALKWSIGNMREVRTMRLDKWEVVFTSKDLAIGCVQHSIEEWRKFTNADIEKLDNGASKWWNKWSDIIFAVIDQSQKG